MWSHKVENKGDKLKKMRKKSFIKVLVRESRFEIIVFGILLYLIITGLLGCRLFSGKSGGRAFVIGNLVGIIVLSCMALVLLIAWLVFLLISAAVGKIGAVKRYTNLPLSADELRECMNNNTFKDSEEYFKYICDQMRYKAGTGRFTCWSSLKLSKKDLYELCNAAQEVFGKPVMIGCSLCQYLMDYDLAFPVSTTLENDRISAYILSEGCTSICKGICSQL